MSDDRKKRLVRGIAFGAIWMVFLTFGIFLRAIMPWDHLVELHGLDYTGQGILFSDHTRILTPVFRHLFLYLITAPLSLFGRRILDVGGPWPYWCFLLTFFSAVMAGAVMLVHATLSAVQGAGRGTAVAGTALFFSFSYTWLLAACPESYPLACLAGLLVLRWGLSPMSSRGWTGRAGWCALTLLNGGITTSNGVKVVLAYLAARGLTRRRLVRAALVVAAVVATMLVAILIRYLFFNMTHNATKSCVSEGVSESLTLFRSNLDVWSWLSLAASFFSEPIVTHGDMLTVNHLVRPYGNILAPLAVLTLYGLAAAGAWRAWKHPLVKMTLAMFSLDFLLHIVLRWGLDEGHIYCGHWLYMPALLAAMLPVTCTGRARRICVAVLCMLALAIFACGAHAFVTAPPDDGHEAWPGARFATDNYPSHFYKKP